MNDHQTRKSTILIVTENLNVGGAEKYTVLIANALLARGHRVVVFANEGPFREQLAPGIRFVRAHFERGILGVAYGVLRIAQLSLGERVSLLHAQKLECLRACWIARFLTGVPVVATAHGYTRKELLSVGRRINRYSNLVVTVVDWLVDELEKNGVERRKLRLIYNGMIPPRTVLTNRERSELRASLGYAPDDVVIVSISRLEKGKNHAQFLASFPEVLRLAPTAKYLIVGNGPERDRIAASMRMHNLSHSVRLVAGTVHAEPYLQIADIFCTPAVAQGMAVLEAMAAGLPVVGTAPQSGPEIVQNGATGFVVPKGEWDALARKLGELAADRPRASMFGKAARVRQMTDFPLEKTVDDLERAYADSMKMAG